MFRFAWSRVHKAFQNEDQVKNSFTMDFSITYYNHLTINCWCLIKCVLQTRLPRILCFFMQENVNFMDATVVKFGGHQITGLTLL